MRKRLATKKRDVTDNKDNTNSKEFIQINLSGDSIRLIDDVLRGISGDKIPTYNDTVIRCLKIVRDLLYSDNGADPKFRFVSKKPEVL